MSKPTNIFILLAFAGLWFSACATTRPAIIKNGVYSNFNYGFSISVPKGWHYTSEIPDWLKKDASVWLKLHTQFMCFNNETNGFIAITGFETLRTAEGIQEYIKGMVVDVQKKEKQESKYVKSFSADFYPLSNDSGLHLVSMEQEEYENEFSKMRSEVNFYFYERDGKSNCLLTISLISTTQSYEENKKIYENFLQSLAKLKQNLASRKHI